MEQALNKRGWLKERPDHRDYYYQSKEAATGKASKLPKLVDLTEYCSPVRDQGSIGSCTAFAAVSLIEQVQNTFLGGYAAGSPRFVYKLSRIMDHQQGDCGSYLRTAMKVLRAYGVPPEEYLVYSELDWDKDIPPHVYALAQNYQAIEYRKLTQHNTLESLKSCLSKKLPVMFGFTTYREIDYSKPHIPFPAERFSADGGHAVLAVGYNDSAKAILFKNSWGAGWGRMGFGTMPYDYVTRGIADDFWTVSKTEYLDMKQFD